MAGNNSWAQSMSGGKQNSFLDWSKATMNTHTPMIVVAFLLLMIAFIWLIGLSGVQTGSCTTSGLGSLVASSTNEDLTPNPTYEVVSEFFIAMFLILGVAMLAYVMTTKRAADKLIERGEVYGALIVNGKKDLDPNMIDETKKKELENNITLLGLPVNTISAGLKSIKDQANARGKASYAYMKGGARESADVYDNSMAKSAEDRKARIARETRPQMYPNSSMSNGKNDDNKKSDDDDDDDDDDN